MATRNLVAAAGTYVSKFKKPDEKSHPDPLKRYAALKKWNAVRDKIMGYEPVKTFEKADNKANEAKKIQDEVDAIQKEIGATKDEKKKLTLQGQLDALIKIRNKNKDKNKN